VPKNSLSFSLYFPVISNKNYVILALFSNLRVILSMYRFYCSSHLLLYSLVLFDGLHSLSCSTITCFPKTPICIFPDYSWDSCDTPVWSLYSFLHSANLLATALLCTISVRRSISLNISLHVSICHLFYTSACSVDPSQFGASSGC
jgi:hypothetical protein